MGLEITRGRWFNSSDDGVAWTPVVINEVLATEIFHGRNPVGNAVPQKPPRDGKPLKELRIVHPYARATPPGARSGGIYLVVENAGKEADRLVGAASPAARIVEIHAMRMEGNMMRMRPVAALDIPAGGKATLAPGGYHVMLSDLHAPLVAGATVPLTLKFEKAGTIDVTVDVEAAGAGHAGGSASHGN
jgi:copper(I)-binding protein